MTYFRKSVLFLALLAIILVATYNHYPPKSAMAKIARSRGAINIDDPNLKYEVVASGLRSPTTMAFLGPNDILVNEKLNGTVQRIIDGKIQSQPVLDVSVANKNERGMLGIVVAKPNSTNGKSSPTYVFVSFTETKVEGSDICPKPSYCLPGHDPIGNRLYRYEFDNNTGKLINPKLLLDLPAVPGPGHNSGKIIIGPDNNLYFTIGDVGAYKTETQNYPNNPNSNGTSAVYRITQDGKAVKGIIGDKDPLDKYYAYGLRNSFGMDFDPVTGKLWDTENGAACCDEINLVDPGFNSGWRKVQGFWEVKGNTYGNMVQNPTDLVDFGGKGKYRSPEFVWLNTTGPTAIKFLNSDKLGKQYQNDMFVADYHGGNIYHFKLNQNRTGLVLNGTLADKIANNAQELDDIIFVAGMGAITDLQVSPYDGYLYAVSFSGGKIYRILPATVTTTSESGGGTAGGSSSTNSTQRS
ncbi:MAG TPA: PQQ-dependent sugar dehydrogenase [Nitrososphaeraceae archaeon]|nr:PQQ-dependent sugar dehydrogenase [Nitrososphaeraceae archaeon]